MYKRVLRPSFKYFRFELRTISHLVLVSHFAFQRFNLVLFLLSFAIAICDMRSSLLHAIAVCDLRSGPPHAIAIKPPNIVLHVYLNNSTLTYVQCSERINQPESWTSLYANKLELTRLHIFAHNVNTITYKSKIIFWYTKNLHFLMYMLIFLVFWEIFKK